MGEDKSKKIDQGAKLGCPKCVGMLQNKEVGEMEGKPTYIDQCFSCSGIWFDEGELERTLKLKLAFDDEKAERDFRPDWTGGELDLKEANCPRCKKKMERVKGAQDDRVVTDYCLDCGGAWLDGGEIRLLMRGGPIKRAIKYIGDRISDKLTDMERQRRMRPR